MKLNLEDTFESGSTQMASPSKRKLTNFSQNNQVRKLYLGCTPNGSINRSSSEVTLQNFSIQRADSLRF